MIAQDHPGRPVPVLAALLALGAFSQVAQALMIRELLVVFYGNEISLGAFYGAWLMWIGLGAGATTRLGRRRLADPVSSRRALAVCLLLLPLLLGAQLGGVRLARLLVDASATELISLDQLFLATLALTMPVGVALGAAFPIGCAALGRSAGRAVGAVTRLYVAEALGALGGGLLFTFALVEWLPAWRSLGVATLMLGAAAWRLGPRWRAAGVVGLGVALAATPLGGWLEARSEAARFASIQPGMERLASTDTRYGHVDIARLGAQVSLLADGHIVESSADLEHVARTTAYLYAQGTDARRVLLLGAGGAERVAELLRYPIEVLDWVVPDARAFALLLAHLSPRSRAATDDPRVRIHFEDGRRFLGGGGADRGPWELVLVLGIEPSSAHQNRYFTRDFYQQIRASMAPGGVLCTRISSASNYLGRDVRSYSGSVFQTLAEVFAEVVVAPGDSHYLCAAAASGRLSADPEVLAGRHRRLALAEGPPGSAPSRSLAESFVDLLPPERTAFVRRQLESERGAINTDLRPVTYFLNMVLWGKFSGSALVEGLHTLQRLGPWPYLIPILVWVLGLALRQLLQPGGAATHVFTLAALGFVAMALQLQLLMAYQARVGVVFGRVALLNGLFMTGAAIGAGWPGRRLARRRPGLALAGVMALVAAGAWLLPAGLARLADGPSTEPIFLALVSAAGLLTGTGFPLGLALSHRQRPDVVRAGGIIEAADHLGGALGGGLTGALLVPLLGVEGSSHLLAVVAIACVLPLLLAERRAPWPSALRARGWVSFPWPWISWGLLWLVASGGLLGLLARESAPGPTLRFDDEALAAVSGSATFEQRSLEVPHALGAGGAAAPASTVSLASMAVAADVRGYAGPINLLVAVDDQGTLRGAALVHSDETPAYIEGLEAWLGDLAGRALASGPMSLEQIDALSGATITSRAALASINRAAAAAGRLGFGARFAQGEPQRSPGQGVWRPRFGALLVLLLLFFPVYAGGRDRARLLYLIASAIVLGAWLNAPLTEIDLANLSLGRAPSLASNPGLYLLLGFVGLTSLLYGQVYCGYVCPFGALQELMSRAGRRLGLRRFVDRWLDLRLRYLKFVLLAAALIAFWSTGELGWIAFDPMQHVFRPGAKALGWMGWVAAVTAVASLVHYRFWCRYFCPLGACLALGNKLAFWRRSSPQRSVRHCDLGVRGAFDVDCIQCDRCISRIDIGLGRRNPPTGGAL